MWFILYTEWVSECQKSCKIHVIINPNFSVSISLYYDVLYSFVKLIKCLFFSKLGIQCPKLLEESPLRWTIVDCSQQISSSSSSSYHHHHHHHYLVLHTTYKCEEKCDDILFIAYNGTWSIKIKLSPNISVFSIERSPIRGWHKPYKGIPSHLVWLTLLCVRVLSHYAAQV